MHTRKAKEEVSVRRVTDPFEVRDIFNHMRRCAVVIWGMPLEEQKRPFATLEVGWVACERLLKTLLDKQLEALSWPRAEQQALKRRYKDNGYGKPAPKGRGKR